jgi:predicted signal transduction protein with EAL and GGDEF domain
MPSAAAYAFADHQLPVAIAGSVCLFGTWVGMRQFARARATEGTTRSPSAAAIVRTVLTLGDSLGMPVLAEGIETEAQWQFLGLAGCAKGQGCLFAKPVSLAQLPAVIDAAARCVRDAPSMPATVRATAAA